MRPRETETKGDRTALTYDFRHQQLNQPSFHSASHGAANNRYEQPQNSEEMAEMTGARAAIELTMTED